MAPSSSLKATFQHQNDAWTLSSTDSISPQRSQTAPKGWPLTPSPNGPADGERRGFDSVIYRPFVPYPGNPADPIDICVDSFLYSSAFELICIQAVQLAAVLPCSAPPATFISFERTPMHHWYQALLMEFIDTFMRHLRVKNMFPRRITIVPNAGVNNVAICEDPDAFNVETKAHIDAILASFNYNFAERGHGSVNGLSVDLSQPNAPVAALALQETVSVADWPPKKDWKVGELLHAEYRRRLRMFEVGVMRLVAERDQIRWVCGLPGALKRGVNAYKERYVACLREEILMVRRWNSRVLGSFAQKDDSENDDIFA